MAHLLVFWSFCPYFFCWHMHFALASFVDVCHREIEIFPLLHLFFTLSTQRGRVSEVVRILLCVLHFHLQHRHYNCSLRKRRNKKNKRKRWEYWVKKIQNNTFILQYCPVNPIIAILASPKHHDLQHYHCCCSPF